MEEKGIRILLVDDHDLVLQGLKRIIECSLPEVKNICTASSGCEAVALILSQRFDLYVLDLELPDMSGLDVIASIREKDPGARIIINTMHEEIWFIKNLIQCDVDGICSSLSIRRASPKPSGGCWRVGLIIVLTPNVSAPK